MRPGLAKMLAPGRDLLHQLRDVVTGEFATTPIKQLGSRAAMRARFKLLLKIVATLAILILLIVSLDMRRLLGALSQIELSWLVVGFVGSLIFVALRIVKWVVLTRANGLEADGSEIARVMLAALALGIVTPARVGEVVAVAPYASEERPKAVFAYLYDRVGELCVVLLFSVPAALFFLGGLGIALSIAIAAGCAGAIAAMNSRIWRIKLGRALRTDRIPKLDEALTAAVTAPAAYWLLCTVNYFVGYGLIIALIRGAQHITDWSIVLILPVVTLSNLISITVGGLGIREGLAAALAPAGGVAPEVAAMAFFLAFVFTRVLPGLVGLAWTTSAGRTPAETSPIGVGAADKTER